MTRKHRDDLLALALVLAAAVLCYLGSRYPTFRLFFAWPNGGTWSNTLAWLEDGGTALFVLWYFRDHVGKRLAAWWHLHHAPHLRSEVATIRADYQAHARQQSVLLDSKLAEHARRLDEHLDRKLAEHHEAIRRTVTGGH